MSERYPVKWYSDKMQGAPQIYSGTSSSAIPAGGELTTLLKAVLVTGFGLLPADSLSYDTATGLVTCTISAGHSYLEHSIVNISDASDAAYNGEQRVQDVTATTFTYQPVSAPNVLTINGGASVKVAPLGWEVAAENLDGNVVIFKSSDPSAFSGALRVDNRPGSPRISSNYALAMVGLVDDIIDVDNYKSREKFETYWAASGYNSSNSSLVTFDDRFKGWDIVGDSRFFFYFPIFGAYGLAGAHWFGDINSYRPGENYGSILSRGLSASRWDVSGNFQPPSLGNESRINRPHTQLDEINFYVKPLIFTNFIGEVMSPQQGTNPTDNQVYISSSPVLMGEVNPSALTLDNLNHHAIRGELPGVLPFITGHHSFAGKIHNNLTESGSLDLVLRVNKSDSVSSDKTVNIENQALLLFPIHRSWRGS